MKGKVFWKSNETFLRKLTDSQAPQEPQDL